MSSNVSRDTRPEVVSFILTHHVNLVSLALSRDLAHVLGTHNHQGHCKSPNFFFFMDSHVRLAPDPGTTASTTMSQELYDKIVNNQVVLTHGYVHGHIHKHQDHTHIHGHIHNHDHDHHHSPKQLDLSCMEFNEIDLCDDILCDELDDCYFHSCDDSHEECSEQKCCAPVLESQLYLEPMGHTNNLCDLQLNKKPIFEDLIDNVHRSVDEPPRKRIKSEKVELHFPHPCHPSLAAPTQDPHAGSLHHHMHQLCFHTRIPNASDPEKPLSDYDFYIQFDNFSKYLELQSLPMLKELFQDTFPCKWDNCYRRVTDDTLMKHLLSDHITPEFSKHGLYQCEWNECNFINDDFDLLISHLNCHKGKHSIEGVATPALTPISMSKSLDSSPHDFPDLQPTKKEGLNITSMKIKPIPHREAPPIDPEFRCNWQIGTEPDGKPIACGKAHADAGALHNHLIDHHIGLGKSIYHCNWVGCERNHGKSFSQKQKLLRHIHIHTNHKPCRCTICGAAFAVELMLKQHHRIHLGEKPYECPTCGKRFSTSSSLSIHNRVHTGEKPLVCKWPNCGKRFSESSNLTKHMKLHTKLFKCEVCGEHFDKKPALTKHQRVHA